MQHLTGCEDEQGRARHGDYAQVGAPELAHGTHHAVPGAARTGWIWVRQVIWGRFTLRCDSAARQQVGPEGVWQFRSVVRV